MTTFIVIGVFLFLVTAFLPVLQLGVSEFAGRRQCLNENCYWNTSLVTCYNGSDQGAACPADIPTVPLRPFFHPLGLIMVLGMLFVIVIVIQELKHKPN